MRTAHQKVIARILAFELHAMLEIVAQLERGDAVNRLRSLFNGAELASDNIHARLRRIRNLADIVSLLPGGLVDSSVGARRRSDQTKRSPSVEALEASLAVLGDGTPTERRELATLLSDYCDSARVVVRILAGPIISARSLQELRRHLDHLRRHFDYAELSVIACLKTGAEPAAHRAPAELSRDLLVPPRSRSDRKGLRSPGSAKRVRR